MLFGSMLLVVSSMVSGQYFGGQPPLRALDERRHLFKPYSAVQLNCLGANYCENMLDMRVNTTSFTHQNFDVPHLDAFNLQFPDDSARFVEALAWEDEYSGVVRLETARRLVLGMMAAHIPGTQGYHFFRHRSGGKTYLIFDHPSNDGRVLLSTWGDDIQGAVTVGFRARFGDAWLEPKDYVQEIIAVNAGSPARVRVAPLREIRDTPEKGGTPGVARSPEYWNESPYVFVREFKRGQSPIISKEAPGGTERKDTEIIGDCPRLKFTGRYWLSDEDMPIEYGYEAPKADRLAITIGEPGKHIPLLYDAKTPGIIEFGDRKTRWQSDKDGDQVLKAPECRYLVLWKNATWACPGYGSALLVMWDGQPEAIEAVAENGYGQVRVVYGSEKRGQAPVSADQIDEKQGTPAETGASPRFSPKGKVWLYPFHWINPDDMEYVFRNAESFLATGKLMHNGYPSQQMVNAIPSGLAAGAYLLTKYNDPLARTAQIEAENAADVFLEPEHKGRWFLRLFFEVKTAAWMVRLGKLTNDQTMVEKYTPWVKLTMDRLLSKEAGYDGKAWGDGWTHFCTMRTVWLAYEATGNQAYREAYERAMDVYTIDAKGVYRYGEPLKAPGGFDVYAGSLPMGVWGHWGLKDRVDQLINLQVPNGWHNPDVLVSDLWNDAGAGPWSQDDAQPEMVGFMLRGYNLPTQPKRILPTGAFSMLDDKGGFKAEFEPIVDNPFFLPGEKRGLTTISVEQAANPITDNAEMVVCPRFSQPDSAAGLVKVKTLELSGTSQRIDVAGTTGAALDIRMDKGAYQVEVSPDGEHWLTRLDTWCDKPTTRSIDLSFLLGNNDELVKALELAPPDDAPYLQSSASSEIVRTHSRTVTPEGNVVYRLSLPKIDQCHLEFLVGNNYRIDLSPDGTSWTEALSPAQIPPRQDVNLKNAGWLRMVDATKSVGDNGTLFIRFRNGGNDAAFGNEPAFLRRLAVYATYKTAAIDVRVTPAPYSKSKELSVKSVSVRSW